MGTRRRVLQQTGAVLAAGLTSIAGCVLWGKTKPASIEYVVPTDGGFLGFGEYAVTSDEVALWVLVLDDDLAVERSRRVAVPGDGAISGVETVDDGILVFGEDDGVWLQYYDGSGDRRYTRRYGDLDEVNLHGAVRRGDDVVAVGGDYRTVDYRTGEDDVDEPLPCIYELGPSGSATSLADPIGWGELYAVFDVDDGYLVAGWTLLSERRANRGDLGDAVLAHVDVEGETTVRHRFDEGRYYGGDLDGDRLLLRGSHLGGHGVVPNSTRKIQQMHRDGTQRWSSTPELDAVRAVALRPDGGAVVVGNYAESNVYTPTPQGTEPPPTGPWAAGYDRSGTRQWMKDPGSTIVGARSVAGMGGDRFVVSGWREDPDSGETDGWVAVLDGTGTVHRSKRFRPPEGAGTPDN